jgi:transcriptional regulator of acetoin/glycerol metabolism
LQKERHELELVELNQPDTASVIDKLQIQIDIWQKEVAISQMQYDYHKSSDLAYMYKQSVEWKQHLVDEKMKKLADELERQKPLEITDSAKDSVAMSDPKNQKAQDEVKVSVAVDIQRKQENLQQSNDQKSTVPLNEVPGKQESSLPFVQELHNNNSRKKLVAKVTALVTIPAYYLYKKKDQKKVENN